MQASSKAAGAMTPAETEAFRDSLLALLPAMRAFARYLVAGRGDPDDLVQDTVVSAWANRAGFSLGTNLRAWLFTIMRNQFINDARRQSRMIATATDELMDGLKARAEQDGRVALRETERALRCLRDDQRQALVLVAALGLSYEEAAAVCGCAVGTIKSRVSRGRAQLLELLGTGRDS
jgi:RNA polymerase sigma-70 factor (ECF subfamily)